MKPTKTKRRDSPLKRKPSALETELLRVIDEQCAPQMWANHSVLEWWVRRTQVYVAIRRVFARHANRKERKRG